MPASAPPKLCIITPNYNYGRFIETALTSVLNQDYPNLEYIVIDGGSTDDSVAVIRRYEHRLAHWEISSNEGQYHAITRGFNRGTGEILGWLNSDDAYLPGALSIVADVFVQFPQVDWLTTLFPLHRDERGRLVRADQLRGFSRRGFLAGEHLPTEDAFSLGYVQQESTFWRRSLWERAGGSIDPEFVLAGDFALWGQFFQHADLYGLAAPIAGFRVHSAQITSRLYPEYYAEAVRALQKYGGSIAGRWKRAAREIAARSPPALHAPLERCNLINRAVVVRWDLCERDWKLEERFI